MTADPIADALQLDSHNDPSADVSPNSGAFWHPILADAGVPVPETRLCDLWMADEEDVGFDDVGVRWDADAVHEAVLEVGGYPAFVRTAFTSAKHDFEDACKIDDRDEIDRVVGNLVHEPVRKWLPAGCLMVREWLDLDVRYTGFRANTPIAPEVRMFVEDGSVACLHPYWPRDAVKNADVDDVEAVHDEIDAVIAAEEGDVCRIGEAAAEALDGAHGGVPAWSVDVARTSDGEWVAIDAAHAGTSHHPGECENEYPDPR